MAASGEGLYCSTSGTFFTDKQALADHYRSDFHRYNLKRKVADLPPVTREWFEAHKSQLLASVGRPEPQVWIDPLTKKKFSSEHTYNVYINSNKYKEIVRKSGAAAPKPIVQMKANEGSAGSSKAVREPAQFTMSVPNGVRPQATPSQGDNAEDSADEESSGWETASDADMEAEETAGAHWEEWDVRQSLFDNHMSATMEDNLEYMWKHFGFYFPDAEALTDPEGLLRYLGAKLQYGHVPLYVRGDDERSRRYSSLHAVQRHMVDTNHCKMIYDGNEEEYDAFYAQNPDDVECDGGFQLALGTEPVLAQEGLELVLPEGPSGRKVLGARQLAKYYKQKYRPQETRLGVAVNTMLARYRALGVATTASERKSKAEEKHMQRASKIQLKTQLNANVTRNLPKNVPY